MLINPKVVFFIYLFYYKIFKKVFLYYFTMNNIIIYYITIIPNIQNKIFDFIKFKIVKNWLT